jgi:hypothetical protein
MGKLFSMHPSDDQLDLYCLGRLSLEAERLIEDHYLICAKCQERVGDVDEFIAVLRTVRDESLETAEHVPRRPMARVVALTLITLGTALVCNDPAPLPKMLPKPAVVQVTMPVPQYLEIRRPKRVVQPFFRRYGPRRIFEAPPVRSDPMLAAAETLELPSYWIIPSDWVEDQSPVVMAEQLYPEPPPRFELKPRWFRRAMMAVLKRLDPMRW